MFSKIILFVYKLHNVCLCDITFGNETACAIMYVDDGSTITILKDI